MHIRPSHATRAATLVMLVAGLLSLDTTDVNAQTENRTRTVSVTGTGKVLAVPDYAEIRFSVVTRGEDPEVVRVANAEASSAALETVRSLGVDESDIRLDQLSLNPVREWDPDDRKQREVGYEVQRGVTVHVRDLDLVSVVVARVVQSGGNRIGSVRYLLANDEEARGEALAAAVENARAKAERMLSTLNESVGRVLEISEDFADRPSPVYRAQSAMLSPEKAADPSPEAYAPGELEIKASVSITFEIES